LSRQLTGEQDRLIAEAGTDISPLNESGQVELVSVLTVMVLVSEYPPGDYVGIGRWHTLPRMGTCRPR
jgi:hypothetical protein